MDDVTFIIGSWKTVLRIVVVGGLAYFSLVFLIRATTKRCMAQMSAFDFVITVALGSAYGRILTATEVGLLDAITAFALLASLQYFLAAAENRWPRFAHLIKAPPSLLYYRGEFIRDAMRKERISESAILGAARQEGLGSLDQVEAVIMESAGKFGFVQKTSLGDASALRPVTGN